MAINILVTPHAVERFILRISPGLRFSQATAILEERAAHAAPLKVKSINGQKLWKITDPDAILVVKPGRKTDKDWVVVTVLKEDEPETLGYLEQSGGSQSEAAEAAYTYLDKESKDIVRRLRGIRRQYEHQIRSHTTTFLTKCSDIIAECDRDLEKEVGRIPEHMQDRLRFLGVLPTQLKPPKVDWKPE